MKITSVKPVLTGHNMFVKIETDENICGWGEATFTSRQYSVEGMIRHFEPLLIGRDPFRIDQIWYDLLRGTARRGGIIIMTAISGIDEALWDIKGKALNTPVYNLLGGAFRDRLLMYVHINGETVEDLLKNAEKKLKEGYKVLRISTADAKDNVFEPGPMVRDSIKRFKALRNFVGEDIEILIDGHCRFNPTRSVELCNGLAEFRPLFIEDPVMADNLESYRMLRSHTHVPLGTGEKFGPIWDYTTIIAEDLIDYVRTDICNCGGITSMKKIAAYAEAHYMDMVPHGLRSVVGMMSAFHVDMAVPNFFVQESGLFENNEGYMEWDAEIKDGYCYLGNSPGLGVTIHEDRLIPFKSSERPHWRKSDGSVQDW